MRITKFVHSCILVEDDGRTVLFDPGTFSWNSGIIDLASWPQIDEVVITHEHPDHYNEDFIKAAFAHSPNASFVTNESVASKLKALGNLKVFTVSTETTKILDLTHEDVEPFGTNVDHIGVNWNAKVTNPGDTHNFSETKEILLLPITAPWGTTIKAVRLALELKPKVIVPIHDYFLVEDWKQVVYDRAEALCLEAGIKFIKPKNGEPLEI